MRRARPGRYGLTAQPPTRLGQRLRIALVSLQALAASACSNTSGLGYYTQLASGQWQLLSARRPIAELLADPATPEPLRKRLGIAAEARRFASAQLDLPDNRSYTLYADIHRPYVVWNVFATPELSLQPLTHCFPIAGCVSYRGYFSEAAARDEARRLQQQGYDTDVGGVPTYSTLGWFDDPIISTMLRWDDDEMAADIFHELAHQKLYIKGDTQFDESFAEFVEQQGLREWRASRGLPASTGEDDSRNDQFTQLILDTRQALAQLYASGGSAAQLRAGKQAAFEALHARYRALRDGPWQGDSRYDAWMNQPLNNARLLPFGLYDTWVPAFAALFRQEHGQWPAFFSAARRLSQLPPAAREARLKALAEAAPAPAAAAAP